MEPADILSRQQTNFSGLVAVKNNLKKLSAAQRSVQNYDRYWTAAKEHWKAFLEAHEEIKEKRLKLAVTYDERRKEALLTFQDIQKIVKKFDSSMMDYLRPQALIGLHPSKTEARKKR